MAASSRKAVKEVESKVALGRVVLFYRRDEHLAIEKQLWPKADG